MGKLAADHPTAFAFAGIMGRVGLDLTPFGGLEKNVFRSMKAAKTEVEALSILTRMGIADDIG